MRVRLSGFFAALALLFSACAFGDTISGVSFYGSPSDPVIAIFGSGFGPEPAATVLGYPGYSGYDYGDNLYIEDLSTAHGFSAGRGVPGVNTYDLIGLDILYYSSSEIVYALGSDYAEYYYPVGLFALDPGDTFLVMTDATYSGSVTYTPGAVPIPTPEPGSLAMLLTGLATLGLHQRRASRV